MKMQFKRKKLRLQKMPRSMEACFFQRFDIRSDNQSLTCELTYVFTYIFKASD